MPSSVFSISSSPLRREGLSGLGPSLSATMTHRLQSKSGSLQMAMAAFNLASCVMVLTTIFLEGIWAVEQSSLAVYAPFAGFGMAILFFYLDMNNGNDKIVCQLAVDINFAVMNIVNSIYHFASIYSSGLTIVGITPLVYFSLGVCELCCSIIYAIDLYIFLPRTSGNRKECV